MQVSPVLVIGASGFVGRHLCVALEAAGVRVRRASSRRTWVESAPTPQEWVSLDVTDEGSLGAALEDCRSLVYLYHALGTGEGYQEREARAATRLQEAASRAGVQRVVYLGGVIPRTERSQHLESRRVTGEILRAGRVSTIELRAAMIIGHGSASFNLIRDLAVRVPLLALPPWLDNGSFPVAIDDVVYALARALYLPDERSRWFELPGPEWVTHREVVKRLSALLGTRVFGRRVSLLTPSLSARLLALIGRERREMVDELVSGLPSDLTPHGESFWESIQERPQVTLREAILNALADEASRRQPSAATRERLRARGETLRGLAQ